MKKNGEKPNFAWICIDDILTLKHLVLELNMDHT